MKNPLRLLAPRLSKHPLLAVAILALAIIALAVLPSGTPQAQEAQTAARTNVAPLKPAHLNPAIAKLAAGKIIFGTETGDLSRESARHMGNLDTDVVYIDMEHSPLNMDGLDNFIAVFNNKAYTLKRGDAQMKSALIARMPPYGFDHAGWVVKQGLDMGLMGFLFNTTDTKEQAEFDIKNMRYAPYQSNPLTQVGPVGVRGWSPTGALWFWGIGVDEYRRRADLWPLNPEGDLLSFMSIESKEGVDNIEEIASVPGISVLHAAAGGDLSTSYGVPITSPVVEAGRQKILKACLAHNIVCSIHVSGKAEIDRRIKEGWRIIFTDTGTPND